MRLLGRDSGRPPGLGRGRDAELAPEELGRSARLGVRGSAVLVSVGTAASRVVGLVASLAGAALLGADEFGSLAVFTVTAGLVSALGCLGFVPLVTREIADAAERHQAKAQATYVLRAVLGLSLLVAVAYFAFSTTSLGARVLGPGGGVVAGGVVSAWSVLLAGNNVLLAVVAGWRDFRAFTLVSVTRAVAVGLGSVLGAVAFDSAVGSAGGALVGELTTTAVAFAACLRIDALARRGRAGRGRQGLLLKAAASAGFASLLIQVSMWLGQILLLQAPGGASENGGFLLANKLTQVITFLPGAIAVAALPHLAADRNVPQRAARMRTILVQGVLLSIIACLGLIVVAELGVGLIGPDFVQFKSTVAIMCVAGVAIAANNILGSLAVAANRIRLWVWSDIALGISLIVVALFAVPAHGADGLAVAYLVAYALSAGLLIPVLRERSGSPLAVRTS